jgi:CHASE3 domain sensor protein
MESLSNVTSSIAVSTSMIGFGLERARADSAIRQRDDYAVASSIADHEARQLTHTAIALHRRAAIAEAEVERLRRELSASEAVRRELTMHCVDLLAEVQGAIAH